MWIAFKASVTPHNVWEIHTRLKERVWLTIPMATKVDFNELFVQMTLWKWRLTFAGSLEFVNVDWSPPVLTSTDWTSFVKTHTRLGLTAVISGYKEPGSWVPRVACASAQSVISCILFEALLPTATSAATACSCDSFLCLLSFSGCCNFLPLFLSFPPTVERLVLDFPECHSPRT